MQLTLSYINFRFGGTRSGFANLVRKHRGYFGGRGQQQQPQNQLSRVLKNLVSIKALPIEGPDEEDDVLLEKAVQAVTSKSV